eukprot:gnl/MRDRNA2_/MRDRNA2_223519_c0_seq1.p1 gnl/MRDRNA2_/MRDRNA2_223519_c0~~gnl/MRDRNA2_/MRDRNA2_223519_c0_seq1.p1  ORF type:complete len:244 (+),score=44.70 gnl/MRDRNA2_/MRDRNA2_223519_c0_seq1:3-734(+)
MSRDAMLQSIRHFVKAQPGLFRGTKLKDQHNAFSHALSRNAMFWLSQHVSEHVLVPFQDLANHDADPNCNQICNKSGCWFVAKRAIARGEQITHSYGLKSDLNMLFSYGFGQRGSNSAFELMLNASENVTKICGHKVLLNHEAPLAVAHQAATCFEAAAGRQSFLKMLQRACGELSQELHKPGGAGLTMLGMGRPNPDNALRRLEARKPAQNLDHVLSAEIRRELATLQRCTLESQRALDNMI